jgi:hypothetical protein
MSEQDEQVVTTKINWLSVILGGVLVAVAIFVSGYSSGLSEGSKRAAHAWATEFINGTYAGYDSSIGVENLKARRDVVEAAKSSGPVDSFEVDYADIAEGGNLIVAITNRKGVRYKEILRLQGGRLQGFSSLSADEK